MNSNSEVNFRSQSVHAGLSFRHLKWDPWLLNRGNGFWVTFSCFTIVYCVWPSSLPNYTCNSAFYNYFIGWLRSSFFTTFKFIESVVVLHTFKNKLSVSLHKHSMRFRRTFFSNNINCFRKSYFVDTKFDILREKKNNERWIEYC